MKIIVAGGAGYIGSLLVPALVDHGYDVEVIDLLWFGNKLPKEVKVTQKNLLSALLMISKVQIRLFFSVAFRMILWLNLVQQKTL